MGHLGNLRFEYRELATRLAANPVGLPEPENETARIGWQTILELLYTPEEAILGSTLPTVPASLSTIAERCGRSKNELKALLDGMAEKGVVMDLLDPETNEILYSLSPPVVGFFELTMMKLGTAQVSKKAMAEAIAVYSGNSYDFVREVHGSGKTALGRAVVSHKLIETAHRPSVCQWDNLVKIIEDSQFIAVSNCYCRHKAEHLGQNCAAPMEVCLSLNEFGEYVIRRNFGRAIDKRAALRILTMCREHFLVHLVDNVKKQPAWLCNCCKCCCGTLKAVNNFGFPAVNPSSFTPSPDNHHLCIGCKRCVKVCPVGAITVQKENRFNLVSVDEQLCIGCGVCVTACLKNHLKLVQRLKTPIIPDTKVELNILRAFERGKLAELVCQSAQSFGNAYLDQILKVIGLLSPSEQQLAKEQLKSKFVEYMVGKSG